MTLEQLQKQSERMEGFREGYIACLNWMAAHLEQEKREKEAAENKADESVSKA